MEFVKKNIVYDFEPEFDSDFVLDDINFSQLVGKSKFKTSFPKLKKAVQTKKLSSKKTPSPLTKEIPVRSGVAEVNGGVKKLGKVIIPRDRKVIIEGMNKTILDEDCHDVKRINFHNGKKLKEVVFIFNNNGAIDFNLQLFNPSMTLDYLYSTSLNLNDQIKVAGGDAVSYSDLMFNILANPLLVYNAKVVISGPLANEQVNQPFRFINKNTQGVQKIAPQLVGLQVDNFQKIRDCINFFCLHKALNRPFIPDGMDVIEYTVLAGNTVTLAFFCKQQLLKDAVYKKEINGNTKLI